MALDKYLLELADPNRPLSAQKLVNLSDLDSDETRAFRSVWSTVDPTRKQKLVNYLADLAEDNVEVDFNAVFKVCLSDPDEEVRELALRGLWECEERSLIEPLIRLLSEDKFESVRVAAAQALGRFALLAEMGKLLSRDNERIESALMGAWGKKSESIEVRRRALESVAAISKPGVRIAIKDAYCNPDPKVRASALYAMGRNCDPSWVNTLIKEMGNPEAEVRYEAVSALGEIGEQDVAQYLPPLLKDPDLDVQLATIRALGSIGGLFAKKILLEALRDSDERIQDEAQEALENLEVEEDFDEV